MEVLMVWRYTWRDGVPCAVTLFQLGLNLWLAATWDDRSLAQNLWFLPVCLLLFWYNGLVASHNFVHTAWFKSDLLNRSYAVLNSVNIGVPHSHYRLEHVKHHRWVNDRVGASGTTNDPTSTFACGTRGDHEHPFSYCFLGLFRMELRDSFQEIVRRDGGRQLAAEVVACLLGMAIYIGLSWHQEHHIRPGAHWTKRPAISNQLQDKLDRPDRVVLRFPPTLAWLEHRRIEDQHVAPSHRSQSAC
jgi:fatty acid desaturase